MDIEDKGLEEPIKEGKLTLRQEKFCQTYTSQDKELFGNGVQSYLEVYDIDRNKPNWYDTACVLASQLLRNTKVIDRINDLLQEGGLNDQHIDKELLFLVNQHADFGNKLGAIREYNKLKTRITEKKDITSGGKPININVINYGHSTPLPTKEVSDSSPSIDGQRNEESSNSLAS